MGKRVVCSQDSKMASVDVLWMNSWEAEDNVSET